MQTAKLKFTKIEVPEFEKKGLLAIKFYYLLDGKEHSLEKQYGYLNDDPAMFAKDVIAEVKNQCRKKSSDYDNDNILPGYINLQVVEDRESLTSDRVTNALKQVRDKIRTLKTMVRADNYMSRYVEIKGLIIEL